MPTRNITPSSYVGPQVRHFRKQKSLTQQGLVDRLHELGMKETGWNQPKVAKLESGKLTQVLVDDVFELAVALDVSPIYLMTPTRGDDGEGNTFKVWLGGKISRWPHEARQWIRGVHPILHRLDYQTDEDAIRGQRFYLADSQSLGEWKRIADASEYAGRVSSSIQALAIEPESGRGAAENRQSPKRRQTRRAT
jgi:transcriptional regulator with XRE-family HTH domain